MYRQLSSHCYSFIRHWAMLTMNAIVGRSLRNWNYFRRSLVWRSRSRSVVTFFMAGTIFIIQSSQKTSFIVSLLPRLILEQHDDIIDLLKFWNNSKHFNKQVDLTMLIIYPFSWKFSQVSFIYCLQPFTAAKCFTF